MTGPARRDINKALRRSAEDFGAHARGRYQRLFEQAIHDLASDPARVGVKSIEDVRVGYSTYHLRSSASNVSGARVRKPRHVVVFYLDSAGDVVIARVFHERQLLENHLAEGN